MRLHHAPERPGGAAARGELQGLAAIAPRGRGEGGEGAAEDTGPPARPWAGDLACNVCRAVAPDREAAEHHRARAHPEAVGGVHARG